MTTSNICQDAFVTHLLILFLSYLSQGFQSPLLFFTFQGT